MIKAVNQFQLIQLIITNIPTVLEKLPPTREQNSYGVRPRRVEKLKKPSLAKFVKRSPQQKRTQLKYGNLLKLAIILLLLNWLISLPFQARRRNPPEIKVSPSTTLQKKAPPAPPPPMPTDGFYYNVSTLPPWKADANLQTIVDEAVALAKTQGFPIEDLSISLVDVKNPDQHLHAGYQNQVLRFPASVAKLYWLVTFYGAVAKGMITNESKFDEQLRQMMAISSNDAASRVLDAVTDTKSGKMLAGKALEEWLTKRQTVNLFYRRAGYTDVHVSTKNYPIYYLRQEGPVGRDRQMRDPVTKKFISNKVTTDQTARLMYEIYTRRSISRQASTRMAYLLTRDLNPQVWKKDPTNGVGGFLGESLPTNIYFGSKVGYTSKSRQEVAFIRTLDDKAIYVLTVFGTDRAYANSEKIFPALSRLIYDRMVARGNTP